MEMKTTEDQELLNLLKYISKTSLPLNFDSQNPENLITTFEKTLVPFMDEQMENVEKPPFSLSTNYFKEFWRMYLMNDVLVSSLKEISMEKVIIEQKLKSYESINSEFEKLLKPQAKNRRTASEIKKSFFCPYRGCLRPYGTEVALNLHIKKKHKGGNKSDREDFARELFLSFRLNRPIPKTNLNLYNDFHNLIKQEFERIKKKKFKEEFNPVALFKRIVTKQSFSKEQRKKIKINYSSSLTSNKSIYNTNQSKGAKSLQMRLESGSSDDCSEEIISPATTQEKTGESNLVDGSNEKFDKVQIRVPDKREINRKVEFLNKRKMDAQIDNYLEGSKKNKKMKINLN